MVKFVRIEHQDINMGRKIHFKLSDYHFVDAKLINPSSSSFLSLLMSIFCMLTNRRWREVKIDALYHDKTCLSYALGSLNFRVYYYCFYKLALIKDILWFQRAAKRSKSSLGQKSNRFTLRTKRASWHFLDPFNRIVVWPVLLFGRWAVSCNCLH